MDSDGKLREDRRKHFEAFVYFVDRMLPSVNAEKNKYRGGDRKVAALKEVFTASDEAFALLMVDNYWERWTNLYSGEPDDKELTKAKYTSSDAGRCEMGYSVVGIEKYNELIAMVQERRKADRTGDKMDSYMMDYWCGKIDAGKKKIQPLAVARLDMGALFGDETEDNDVQNIPVVGV